jgi:methionyl-tRNA formyltransferase
VRIVYLGTSGFAASVLERLAQTEHRPVLVVTRPDRPAGRGRKLTPAPVADLAKRLGIDLDQPDDVNADEARARIAAAAPDVVVVCAFGALLKEPLLSEFELLNIHPSLLPRWRGAAPIERAIMAGDTETGVMVMRMEAGLDTGPVAMSERVPIGDDTTAGDLSERLAALGADLMVRALSALSRGVLGFTPQASEGATYARKIDKAETRVDWSKPAREVHNHIRGLSPDPGAWFDLAGDRVRALRTTLATGSGAPGTVLDGKLTVACGEGAVRLLNLQRAGKTPLPAADFLRGSPVDFGTMLA